MNYRETHAYKNALHRPTAHQEGGRDRKGIAVDPALYELAIHDAHTRNPVTPFFIIRQWCRV